MLDGGHAEGAEEHDLVTSADGVDISVGTAVSARLAAEVVLKDLLALGGHVAASVLANVLPSLANLLAVDLELVKGVVATYSDGQRQDRSGSLHIGEVVWVSGQKMRKRLDEMKFFDQRRRGRMNESLNE